MLSKLGIETVDDLIHHIPSRLADFSNEVPISDLKIGEKVTLTAELLSITNVKTKTGKTLQIAQVTDDTGKLQIIWMKQYFLLKILRPGMIVRFFGELKFWGKQRAFVFPKFEILNSENTSGEGAIMTTYPLTDGLSSKWIKKRVKHALENTQVREFLQEKLLSQFSLLNYNTSLNKIHFPESEEDFKLARERLAFNELLLLQIQASLDKIQYKEDNTARKLEADLKDIQEFVDKLPFKPTDSQTKAFAEIHKDLAKPNPMNRLLEGDVGSGKTVVASFGAFVAFLGGSQSAFLAPTQVLAEQHYKTLKQILFPFNMNVSLVTGSTVIDDESRTNIYVGTHALLHRPQLFQKTDFIVIDEQHKFGVKQRAKLLEHAKQDGFTPHLLTMTATPIPRTVTLTMYGDLDLTSLDELPSGRKRIKTWVVPKAKRKPAYKWIEKQINDFGVQAFVVCPLIDESEHEIFAEVKAATVEYEKLKKIFKNLKIGLLHGKLKSEDKTKVLTDFRDKKYDILVTTPVVEVGVDIPNATIMMIEASDRFGLAQLHQLRGRVGRSDKQSYCLLFTESKSGSAKKRLKTLEKIDMGRELAEIDLELRGPGEIFGVRQSGLPELKIASWTDIDLVKKTREFAKEVTRNQNKYKNIMQFFRSKQITRN